MKKSLIFPMAMLCLFVSYKATGQRLGINNNNPDPSSLVDMTSTDKGLLIPRVALVNVTNSAVPISSPAEGLLVYNTNASVTGGSGVGFYYFNGSQWEKLVTQTTAAGTDNDWTISGNDIFNANSGDVWTTGQFGAGVANPNFDLSIGHANTGIENDGSNNLQFWTAGTQKMVLTSTNNGRLGIGAVSPDNRLEVGGNITIDNGTGGRIFIKNGGTVLSAIGQANTKMFVANKQNGALGFETNGNERMTIDAAGKVGIGITTPDEMLHVVGKIKMVDGNQQAGYVLTSDANGVAAWQPGSVNTDAQTISLSGADLSIANGNMVDLSSIDTDDQTLSLSGTDLTIADGNTVDLSPIIPAADTTWIVNGDDIYNANPGGVGIGVQTPVAGLHVDHNNITVSYSSPQDLLLSTGTNAVGTGDGFNFAQANYARFRFDRRSTTSGTYTIEFTFNAGDIITFNETNNLQSQMPRGGNLTTSVSIRPVGGSWTTISATNGYSIPADGQYEIQIAGSGSCTSLNPPTCVKIMRFSIYLFISTPTSSQDPVAVFEGVGNVGIGTTTPNEKLHVVGSVQIEDGNQQAGYVLTSDTNGVASWQAGTVNTDAQTISLSGADLSITNGNTINLGSIDTDDQTLSLSGATLAIADGNSVNLSSTIRSNRGIVYASILRNVGNINSNSSQFEEFSVPGAQVGGVVSISPSADLPSNLVIGQAYVTAANVVRVKFRTTAGSSVNPIEMTYYIAVINP